MERKNICLYKASSVPVNLSLQSILLVFKKCLGMKITNVQQTPGSPLCWGNAWASLPSRALYSLRGWECWNSSLDRLSCTQCWIKDLSLTHSDQLLTLEVSSGNAQLHQHKFCTTLKHWAAQLSCLHPSEPLSSIQSVIDAAPDRSQKRKEKESMEVKYAGSIWIKKQYFTEYQWKKSIKLHDIRDQKPLSLN